MVKTYILAPNWTTAPPPDGPIRLGHLLDDLTEFVPINRDGFIEIPERHLNKKDTKDGFKSSRSKLISGELGIFAKVMGLVGVGVGAEMYYKKDSNDVLSCKSLDTVTFDPTASYISEAMDLPEVKNYMLGSKFKAPIYMITGLKIARGSSLQSSSSQEKGVKMDGGINIPGTPVQVGPKAALAVKSSDGDSWEGSTDFIVAFRVRKIWYDHGDVQNKAHNKKGVMQDGTPAQEKSNYTLRTDDTVDLSEILTEQQLTTDKDIEGEEEVNWIIPKDSQQSA